MDCWVEPIGHENITCTPHFYPTPNTLFFFAPNMFFSLLPSFYTPLPLSQTSKTFEKTLIGLALALLHQRTWMCIALVALGRKTWSMLALSTCHLHCSQDPTWTFLDNTSPLPLTLAMASSYLQFLITHLPTCPAQACTPVSNTQ